MNREKFQQQYEALIQGCGTISLNDWTKLKIRGDDRTSFLHNMCTNDIRRLQPGCGCEMFMTDVKGHTIAHAFVLVEDDCIELIGASGQSDKIIEHLQRYIIREDVVLTDESAAVGVMLFCGRQSAVERDAAIGEHVSALVKPWQHKGVMINGVPVQIVNPCWLHVPSYLLLFPANRQAAVGQILESAGSVPCDAAIWDAIRIESGLPLWGVDFDHSHLPQEVARNEQAISFTKGCYLGQETIARIDAMGHVNRQRVAVKFSRQEIPDVGTELRSDEKIVGMVTSSCWSPQLDCPLALAVVRRGSNTPGSRLQSICGEAQVMGDG